MTVSGGPWIDTAGDITMTARSEVIIDDSSISTALQEFYDGLTNPSGSLDLPTLIGDFFVDDAAAGIDITSATLSADNIDLTAASTIDVTSTGLLAEVFSFSLPGFAFTLANVASDAHVIIDGGSVTAAGGLTMAAVSDVTVSATAQAQATDTDTAVDAALALSVVNSSAVAAITGDAGTTGTTVLSIGGDIDISALNATSVTTTADGSGGDAGASIAMSFVETIKAVANLEWSRDT